jgi:hypothetical protein
VGHALAGHLDEVLRIGTRFRTEWERLGRPAVPYLALGTKAVALTYGLLGDLAARAEWEAISVPLDERMDCIREGADATTPMLAAIFLLHRGEPGEAVGAMPVDPDELASWSNAIWRQWYAALWAEAAVLSGRPDATERLRRAEEYAVGNPVAAAMVARTQAWVARDTDALLTAAKALDVAACPYQAARALVLAGGRHRAEGQDRLEALGSTPMVLA